jgi:creatinine amidohydrolase
MSSLSDRVSAGTIPEKDRAGGGSWTWPEIMPVFTDSMLLGEVVRRVGEAMTDRVLITPLMWLGNSHHHMDFKGTLSASPRVYLDLLNDMAENLLAHGFRRIVFINSHGGNTTPGKQAIFEIRQRHRDRGDLLLLFSAYWDQARPNDGRLDLVQSQMGHACEWETSMMLRLAPDSGSSRPTAAGPRRTAR